VPQFVMPQIADQFYWGARVGRLGLGPAPAAPGRLGRAELAARLAALAADGGYRERARALAQRVARDRGVERAVAAIARAA
jgi:sterol 3beta-glucosyltransferase